MAGPYYRLPDVRIRFNSDFELMGENALNKAGRKQYEQNTYSLNRLRAFMYYVLEQKQLTIRPFLDNMGFNPYFLLASTGLGKTVAAPIHSYLKHCEKLLANVKTPRPPLWGTELPRIWIIEPKVAIAERQAVFMNELFVKFIQDRKDTRDVEHPVLFGCKTSKSDDQRYAPIKFVTTGIFAIAARFGWLKPEQDCIIIDEAHETVDAAEGVELGIAICRQQGIPVHYMSATVDTSNLHETLAVHNIVDATNLVRQPKWMHSTHRPMEECIVEMVEKTLVHSDPKSEYFPKGEDSDTKKILASVQEQGRAKGFLIVINSFEGEDSDANTIEGLLRSSPYASEIEILLYARKVIQNKQANEKFERDLKRILRDKKKFVIIATSVVEMGVTFEDLDFVATMDSGFEQVTIGETTLSESVPLPANSLLQRIGRVGRERPGIGYITNEVQAYYSLMSDKELNGGGLQYEPIGLPLRRGSLALVAQYSFRQEWENPEADLKKLNLPSGIHKMPERVAEFLRQRQRLLDLGIAVDNQLTAEGKYCERWLEAGVDLGYSIEVQESLAQGAKDTLLFYLVAATLSNVSFSILRAKDDAPSLTEFETRFNTQTGIPRNRRGVELRGSQVEFCPQSELVALYNIVCYFSNKYARMLFGAKTMADLVRSSYQDAFNDDCVKCGFDPKKVTGLLQGFGDILRIFCDTNYNREDFKGMFGPVRRLALTDFVFSSLTEWDIQRYMEALATLPGRTRITVSAEERGFTWQEVDGERTGMIYADSSSLVMENELTLTAKLVPLPGKGDRKAGDSWRVIHAQYEDLQKSVTPPQEKQDSEEEDELQDEEDTEE